MNILYKLYKKGPLWILKRLKREFISPTFPIFKFINRFINFFYTKFFNIKKFLTLSNDIRFSGNSNVMHAVFDLSNNPITFDFAYFVAAAEAYANSKNKNKIFLWIVKRPESFYEEGVLAEEYMNAVNRDSQDWRFKNILLPIISISPSITSHSVVNNDFKLFDALRDEEIFPAGISNFSKPHLHYNEVFNLLELYDFSGFNGSSQGAEYIQKWKKHKRITSNTISITLREYGFEKSRNTNTASWLQFADWLKSKGYSVIFIPDVDNCWVEESKFIDHFYFPEVCWNLELRSSLYESCCLNFYYSSGLQGIGMLNKNINIISIFPIINESREAHEDIYKSWGVSLEQRKFNFAQPHQWISFINDDFESLTQEFMDYEECFNLSP